MIKRINTENTTEQVNGQNYLNKLTSVEQIAFDFGISQSSLAALIARQSIATVKIGHKVFIENELIEKLISAEFILQQKREQARKEKEAARTKKRTLYFQVALLLEKEDPTLFDEYARKVKEKMQGRGTPSEQT
jgi:hypothetical protein